MAGVDDIIGRWIKEAEKTGELKKGPYWGKPFDFDDGFLETPARIRMAHKILKNAGYIPAEVELMQELADYREQLSACEDPDETKALEQKVSELQQKVTMAIARANSGRVATRRGR